MSFDEEAGSQPSKRQKTGARNTVPESVPLKASIDLAERRASTSPVEDKGEVGGLQGGGSAGWGGKSRSVDQTRAVPCASVERTFERSARRGGVREGRGG